MVEDVKLNQLLMRVILHDFKFKCDFADNGKIAVEKMQAESYDIILMDLHMPEMDGFEADRIHPKKDKFQNSNHCFNCRCNHSRCRKMQSGWHERLHFKTS